MLLAPQSGEETRASIGRGSKRLGTRAHDAWDDLRDELQWAARRGFKRARRGVRGGRWALQDRLAGRHRAEEREEEES